MEYKINITTTQTDYKGKSIFEHAADELMIEETFSEMVSGDTIETSLFGELDCVGDEFTITYQEETEGMLELVYIIEIKGACAQKTVMKMEIEKA